MHWLVGAGFVTSPVTASIRSGPPVRSCRGAAVQLGISMKPIRRSHPRLATNARNDLTASFRERMNIASLALLHTSADVSLGRTLKNEDHITEPPET